MPATAAGVAVATLAIALPTAAPATGAPGAATVCDWRDVGRLSPPLAMKPISTTYSTGGETGTLTCNGPILGQTPTGPGTIGFEARMGPTTPITCTSGGVGDYVAFFTLPVGKGRTLHGIDYGNFSFGLDNGKFGGSYKGTLFTGTFESEVRKGDCDKGVTRVYFHTADAKVATQPRRVVIPGGSAR
jgi:hypothetical protein